MIPLFDQQFSDIGVLSESLDNGQHKRLYLAGTFMEADAMNQNGRRYDKKELMLAVDKINKAAVSGHHILGELDHPPTLVVSMENVCHRLVEAKMDGNRVWGKAEVLVNTPKGAILKSFIDHDIKVGVSSRGSGAVNPNTKWVKGFNFITVDAVAMPSCSIAYPESIMEHLKYSNQGDLINEMSEHVVANDPIAQRYFAAEIKKFITGLSK